MRHESRMWYRRTFEVPRDWNGRHVLLHLDAVDCRAEVTAFVHGISRRDHMHFVELKLRQRRFCKIKVGTVRRIECAAIDTNV